MQASLERQGGFSHITYGGDGNGNNQEQYGEAADLEKRQPPAISSTASSSLIWMQPITLWAAGHLVM